MGSVLPAEGRGGSWTWGVWGWEMGKKLTHCWAMARVCVGVLGLLLLMVCSVFMILLSVPAAASVAEPCLPGAAAASCPALLSEVLAPPGLPSPVPASCHPQFHMSLFSLTFSNNPKNM